MYAPRELLKKSFGEEIEPKYFAEYIREKYLG
jgi:carboxypeptidase Taq